MHPLDGWLFRSLQSEREGVRVKDDQAAARESTWAPAEPRLLAGGNPQIAKADGDAPVQAYIAAMPGWKRDVGCVLDALVVRAVPDVQKAVRWNSPFYGVEGGGVVPELPLLHEVRQSDVLPRHVPPFAATRRIQDGGDALRRHPRGRAVRRGSCRGLDQAGSGATRLDSLSETGPRSRPTVRCGGRRSSPFEPALRPPARDRRSRLRVRQP